MEDESINQGESNPDGYDYQLCSLLYCIHRIRQSSTRIKEYEIGSGVSQCGALDDVVFKVISTNGQEVTCAMQTRYSQNMNESSHLNENSILDYLESRMKTKNIVPLERMGQFILWTNLKLGKNVLDWFERYDPDLHEIDILGYSDVPYKRYRLTENKCKELEQDFLKRPHPRTILIQQLIDSMFHKSVWNMQGAEKDHYQVMAREIFECDGNDSKFKDSFISGKGLSEETNRFRRCFESVMKEKFETESFGEFSMVELNSDSYKDYIELKVDAEVQDDYHTEIKWKRTDVPTKDDVREFLKRFVFYVEVPSLVQWKRFIATEMGNYDQWATIVKSCAKRNVLNSNQIDKFFNLLRLRKAMDFGQYLQLQFNDLSNLEKRIETFYNDENETRLCIKASQNVDCTVSRLIHVVERELEPNCKRYLVFNYKTYNRKFSEIEAILKEPKLIENGLKCIIITGASSNKVEEISKQLLSAVKVIFVGNNLLCDFDDQFNVGAIDEDIKTQIEETEIELSATQCATAKDIFADDLFEKDNYQIVLELYKAEQNKPIQISTDELVMDPHYRPRLIERIDENGKSIPCDLLDETEFYRFVICDEVGTGKSTEFVRIAVDLRQKYQNRLVVYLQCKEFASKWDGSESSMVKIICDSMTAKNELTNVFVKKMLQKGKFILLMDGFDEVASKNHNQLEKLLSEFSTNEVYKSLRLYIASRPNRLERIKKNLTNCVECHLKPFSETDQQEYLRDLCNMNDLNCVEQRTIIDKNTRIMINTFRTILNQNHSLIAIPLQMYMFAVIYKSRIASVDFEPPKPHEIGSLYEHFVELMFQQSVNRSYDMTSAAHESFIQNERIAFLQGHIQIAQAINGGDTSKALEYCTKFQHYGIVRLHPTVGFIHQIYLDYFFTAVS